MCAKPLKYTIFLKTTVKYLRYKFKQGGKQQNNDPSVESSWDTEIFPFSSRLFLKIYPFGLQHDRERERELFKWTEAKEQIRH